MRNGGKRHSLILLTAKQNEVAAIKEAFPEKLALEYDKWYQTPLGSLCDRLEKEAIFSLIGLKKGEYILEVGCGTGNYTLELARRDNRVVGVDSSQKMLKIARFKLKQTGMAAEFIQADAQKLPFPDDTFDLVLSVTACEFVSSPEIALKEMVRVLKPSGQLVIGALNKYSLWALIRRIKGWLGHPIWGKARFFSQTELSKILARQSLENFQSRSVIYFPPIDNVPILKAFQPLETLGQRFLPGLAAFLAISTQKKC